MATTSLPLLGQVRIASPCPMRWEDMEPSADAAVRHCGACRLSVYNLSEMTAARAESFLRDAAVSEGRTCAGFFQRADGTILTKNCPVGLRAARQRAARLAGRAAAAIGLVLTGGLLLGSQRSDSPARLRSLQPFASISEWLSPAPPPPPQRFIAGEICIPTPPPQQNRAASVPQ